MKPIPDAYAVFHEAGIAEHEDVEGVTLAIARAVELAHAHTAGNGFALDAGMVEPEIAKVLTASVARWLLNPERALAFAAGAFSAAPGTFEDWSAAELVVLERYRVSGPRPARQAL